MKVNIPEFADSYSYDLQQQLQTDHMMILC